MENNIINKTEKNFESIKHIDENGVEFWYARELMEMLEYSKWGNFIKVIDKAKKSCENSNNTIFEHFADVGKSLPMPIGCDLHGAEHGGAILAERIKKRSGFFLLRIREHNTCIAKVITRL